MTDIDVKQANKDIRNFKLNNWRPKEFFKKNNTNNTIAIIGPRRSGKSVLIRYLYQKFWKKQFDMTIVFTKCPSTADFYNEFIESYNGDGELVRDEGFNPDIFNIIKEQQTERIVKGEKSLKILMILDDAVDKKLRNTQEFSDIFLMGRHDSFNIQLVFASQSATALNPEQRENLDLLISFRLNLRSDKDRVFKEFIGGMIDDDELPLSFKGREFRFLDKLNQIKCLNHKFFVIDFRDPNKVKFNDIVNLYKVPSNFVKFKS